MPRLVPKRHDCGHLGGYEAKAAEGPTLTEPSTLEPAECACACLPEERLYAWFSQYSFLHFVHVFDSILTPDSLPQDILADNWLMNEYLSTWVFIVSTQPTMSYIADCILELHALALFVRVGRHTYSTSPRPAHQPETRRWFLRWLRWDRITIRSLSLRCLTLTSA